MEKCSNLNDIKKRLKNGKLTREDKNFLDALLEKAENEGLGEDPKGKRVVARLPHGMDIVK